MSLHSLIYSRGTDAIIQEQSNFFYLWRYLHVKIKIQAIKIFTTIIFFIFYIADKIGLFMPSKQIDHLVTIQKQGLLEILMFLKITFSVINSI